jgi:hypothetical protein
MQPNNQVEFHGSQSHLQGLDNGQNKSLGSPWQQSSPYMNNASSPNFSWTSTGNLSRLAAPTWMSLPPPDMSRMISGPRLSFEQHRFSGYPQQQQTDSTQKYDGNSPHSKNAALGYHFRSKESLMAALEYSKKLECAFSAAASPTSSVSSSPSAYESFVFSAIQPSAMNLESQIERRTFAHLQQRRSSSSSDMSEEIVSNSLSSSPDVIRVKPLFSITSRAVKVHPEKQHAVQSTPESKKFEQKTDDADDSPVIEEKCNNRNFNILSKATPSPSGSDSVKKGKRLEAFKGHRRLAIQFTCIGNLGKYPQTCGNGNQVLIPECLSGFHTAYHQRWKFEVVQSSHMFEKNGKKCICLKWTITNIANQTTHTTTETPKQAYIRMSHGRTIASRVFRNAMLVEAEEMEQSLVGETDECRISNVASLIKALRPKTFSEGLLVFGLQHECVQEKMSQMLSEQS